MRVRLASYWSQLTQSLFQSRRQSNRLTYILGGLYALILLVAVVTAFAPAYQWQIDLVEASPQSTPICQAPCHTHFIWTLRALTVDGHQYLPSSIPSSQLLCGYVVDGTTHLLTATTSRADLVHADTLLFTPSRVQHSWCPNIGTWNILRKSTVSFIASLFVALITALLSLPIALHAKPGMLKQLTLVVFTLAIIAFGFLPSDYSFVPIIVTIEFFAANFGMTSLCYLVWYICAPSAASPRFGWLRGASHWFYGGLAVWNFTICCADLGILPSGFPIDGWVAQGKAIWLLLLIAGTFVAMLYGSVFSPSVLQREQSRLVGVAASITLLPFLLVYLWRFSSFDATGAVLLFIVFPPTFTIIVLRRALLAVDSLIYRTLTVVLRWFVLTLGATLGAVLAGSFLHLEPAAVIILFFLMEILALVAPLLARQPAKFVEGWLIPQIGTYRRILAQSTHAQPVLTPHAVAEQLLSAIKLALPITEIALYVTDQALSPQCVIVFGSPSPEYQTLDVRDEEITQLQHGIPIGPTGEHTPALNPCWHLLIPLALKGRLVAVVALGAREDGFPYSQSDQTFLLAVSAQYLIAFDYARVFADLQRAYDRLTEVDQLKDQFIRTAHHELRTPVTSLLGFTYWLDEAVADLATQHVSLQLGELRHCVEKVTQNSSRIAALLESLLQVDPLQVSQNKLFPVQLNLTASIHAAVESVGQTGAITISCDPYLSVRLDDQALLRILMNLVSNAQKYSPPDAPIVVSVQPDWAQQRVHIAIRDWGAGIPPDQQEQIFARFVRLERDMNSPIRGTGLGLYLVKELCTAMGGTISVESTGIPGAGSTFTVDLPLHHAASPNRKGPHMVDIHA